ncbi:gamma-tubulin complex component 6-like [Daphnia carinata]|uniref:gamma-tubulin complex component 6-like n=1 Tax=Daphnia carinata TaxID=120202 RepID=UPI00257FDB46|nr:gamma-tubulin complex component 6-like [Daphnia carinata]
MDTQNSLYGSLCKFFTLVSKSKSRRDGKLNGSNFLEVELEAKEKKRAKREGFSTLFTTRAIEDDMLPEEFQLSAWIFKLRTLIPCSEGNALENAISELEKISTGQTSTILPVIKFLVYIDPIKTDDLPSLQNINARSYNNELKKHQTENRWAQCVPYPVIKHDMFEVPPLNFHIGEVYASNIVAKLESTKQLDELDRVHHNLFGTLENPPKNLNYLGISKSSKLTLGLNVTKSEAKQTSTIRDDGYESPTSHTEFVTDKVDNYWENLENLCDSSSIRRTWEAKLSGEAYPAKELPYFSQAPLHVMETLCHQFEENLNLVDRSLPIRDTFKMEENEIRKDIQYLMLGIESQTFACVDDEFRVNGYPFIDGISTDCLADLVQPLVESGTLVRRLSKAIWNPKFGPVRNTLGDQLLESLQYYQQMVEEVTESQSLLAVVQQLKTLSSSIKIMDQLWHWPGWEGGSGRGAAFLQHLVDLSTVTVDDHERNLLTAYFAACVVPFLLYLEQWIYRGICCDPQEEFFIRIDQEQLAKRDRHCWINGFTFQPINRAEGGPFVNSAAEDDAITGILNDVYLCGKTLHLLQLCQAKELVHGEPSLRIGLSLSELNDIRLECATYALKFPAAVDFVNPVKDLSQQARETREFNLAKLVAENEAKQIERARQRTERHALAKAELDEQMKLKRAEENKIAYQEKLLDEDIQQYHDEIDKREAEEKRRLLIKYTQLLESKENSNVESSEDELNANDQREMDEENNIVILPQSDNANDITSITTPTSTLIPPSTSATTTISASSTRRKKKILTREEIKTKVLREEFGIDPRYTKEETESNREEDTQPTTSPYEPKSWTNPVAISYPFQFGFQTHPQPIVKIEQEKKDWLQQAKPSEEEIRDFSLSFFVQRSLLLPIRTQCQMVNRSLMTLLTGPDHRFMQHLEALRQYLFLDNGAFSHSLVSNIGRRLGQITHIHQLINIPSMNFILQSALNAIHADEYHASRLSFYIKEATGTISNSQLEALECFTLRYRVGWPLNLILTEEVMDDYSQIFSFVLQLRLAAWALEDVYVNLMRDPPSLWHSVHIARHSIYHFVQTLQNYVMNQLLTLAWSEFLTELKKNGARSLDDLYELHSNYVHRAKSRLLLTPKSSSLLKIIRDALNLALKFRGLLLAANYVHTNALQSQINSISAKAREYAKFIRLILEKVKDRSHQPHFHDLLMKLNYNEYYSN